jgi:hypothetical protein
MPLVTSNRVYYKSIQIINVNAYSKTFKEYLGFQKALGANDFVKNMPAYVAVNGAQRIIQKVYIHIRVNRTG